jgi:hypothetical protein
LKIQWYFMKLRKYFKNLDMRNSLQIRNNEPCKNNIKSTFSTLNADKILSYCIIFLRSKNNNKNI